MNLFRNVKAFSSFTNIINLLSTLITIMKVLAGLFLAVQVVMMFIETKSKPLHEVVKLA